MVSKDGKGYDFPKGLSRNGKLMFEAFLLSALLCQFLLLGSILWLCFTPEASVLICSNSSLICFKFSFSHLLECYTSVDLVSCILCELIEMLCDVQKRQTALFSATQTKKVFLFNPRQSYSFVFCHFIQPQTPIIYI